MWQSPFSNFLAGRRRKQFETQLDWLNLKKMNTQNKSNTSQMQCRIESKDFTALVRSVCKSKNVLRNRDQGFQHLQVDKTAPVVHKIYEHDLLYCRTSNAAGCEISLPRNEIRNWLWPRQVKTDLLPIKAQVCSAFCSLDKPRCFLISSFCYTGTFTFKWTLSCHQAVKQYKNVCHISH